MAIQFDPITKRIVLDSAYVDIKALYSRWKEWARSNLNYAPAFSTVGGDPLGGSRYIAEYFFLKNGWRIQPMQQNHSLKIDGNIAISDSYGGEVVTFASGDYKVIVEYTVPVQAQGIATSGSSVTVEEILSALTPYLQNLNISRINNIPIVGTGTENNPWGPA